MGALTAGFVYATGVFATGCVLGTVRLLLLAPRVGASAAVLLEAPFMLGVSWWLSLKCVRYWAVSAHPGARILMGAAALGILLTEELGLAVLAFGQSPAAYAHSFLELAGAIGLGAQLLFACFPALQARCTTTHHGGRIGAGRG